MNRTCAPHEDLVQKALVEQLGQMRLNAAKVLRGPAAESLHDLRVAALRAGFALKFFRKFISGGNVDKIQNDLSYARAIMGKRRDLDIFFFRISKDLQDLNIPSSQKQEILKIIQSKKVKARQELVKMLRSSRNKEMLQDLKLVASTRNKRKLKPQSLLKGILKGLECKQKALRPAGLHKVRIIFKNLRYAYEFLADLYDAKKMKKVMKDIIKAQDVLGENEDAENAVRMLIRLKISGKLKGIDRLVGIEKDRACQARKKFLSAIPQNIKSFAWNRV